MELATEYPPAWIALCVLIAAAYAGILYFRNRANRTFSVGWVRLLTALRFSTVLVLTLLFLRPFFKQYLEEVEPPLIVFAQDRSASLRLGSDSTYLVTTYADQVSQLEADLSERYRVERLDFGDVVTDTAAQGYEQAFTDFSALLRAVEDRYGNTNLGAVIVASDGIVNRGMNPLYYPMKYPVPIYTVALGDSAVRKDVLIREVLHNAVAYRGNEFPIKVTVQAQQVAGSNVKVSIEQNGKEVAGKTISVSGNEVSREETFFLQSDSLGIQRYRVRVSALDNEATYANNQRDVFIDILENRNRILIVAQRPHPDVAALKSVLQADADNEVVTSLWKNWNEDLTQFNLVIVHGVDDPGFRLAYQRLRQSGIPVWWVFASQENWLEVNKFGTGLRFNFPRSRSVPQATKALTNQAFTLFQPGSEAERRVTQWPAVTGSLAEVKAVVPLQSALFQQIEGIATLRPLWAFWEQDGYKQGFIWGEGIWRWKLDEYRRTQSTEVFTELVSKSVQYLVLQEDRSRFQLTYGKQLTERDPFEIRAEFYNASYERITDPEVTLELRSDEGASYEYVFGRQADRYTLNTGLLDPGNYTFTAATKFEGQTFTKQGEFAVSASTVEALNTRADFLLLEALADRNGGQFILPEQLSELPDLIESNTPLQGVVHTREAYTEILEEPWILIVILLLVTGEWFVRRWWGVV